MRKSTNQNQTKTNQNQGKTYLQNELMQYVIDKKCEHLQVVANIVAKKVLAHYAQTSEQGYYLWQCSKNPNTQNFDVLDLRQQAILSLIENIDIQDQQQDYNNIIKQAFKSVNNYLYSLRAIQISTRPFEYSIEYLTEQGIQLVNIHNGICKLVKDDEHFDIYEQDDNNEQAKANRKLVIDILRQLTPLQKQIAKMLALGNSQRQIATKLNRAISTINEHIQAIRKKANQIKDNK